MSERWRTSRVALLFLLAGLLTAAAGYGARALASASEASGVPGTAYALAYKKLKWGPAATVSFSGSCKMTLKTTGVPPVHDDYYLMPLSTQYPTLAATTPSGMKLAVVPYTPSAIRGNTVSVDICPSKAAHTTATPHGLIGYLISGEALYTGYEAGTVVAMSDNVSYTFTAKGGKKETAWFLDHCNSHATPLTTPLTGGAVVGALYTWHYHGVPKCLTPQVDGASGPSHLIGFALDGFPIYGGRDIHGKVISLSQLDGCNGITSPTPEFPHGAYHYVLPIGVTTKQSSIACYAGTVSPAAMAMAQRFLCGGIPSSAARDLTLDRARSRSGPS